MNNIFEYHTHGGFFIHQFLFKKCYLNNQWQPYRYINKKNIKFSRVKTVDWKKELETRPPSLKLSIYMTFTDIGSVVYEISAVKHMHNINYNIPVS